MEFNDKELAELKKISELSSRNAAEALSLMIGKEVSVKFPTITIKPMDEVKKLTGEMIISICELEGDMRGNILLAFSKVEGLTLLDVLMMQKPGTLNEMTKESEGAFNELNNIVGGAYVSALANYLSFKIFPKPPKFMGDLKTVQMELIQELSENTDNIMLMDAALCVESSRSNGLFFMLFDNESLTNMMKVLRTK